MQLATLQLTTLLTTIEIAATIAFAMSGLIEATRRKMDIVGVFSVTFVSAFAGGTVRDILIERRPFFWVENTEYIWLVIALVLAAPLLLRSRELRVTDKVMEVADALERSKFGVRTMPGMNAITSTPCGDNSPHSDSARIRSKDLVAA